MCLYVQGAGDEESFFVSLLRQEKKVLEEKTDRGRHERKKARSAAWKGTTVGQVCNESYALQARDGS